MSNARRVLADVVRELEARDEGTRPIPDPSPPGEHRQLCIGMSTYDDFDGVYFTIEAIRMYHPEILDRTSFLIVDNHPQGPAAADLKHFADAVPAVRYLPFRGFRSTAVRDLVFREARSDVVLCVDSHVLFSPGALQALLDYFDADPHSLDLVQGPLMHDDLNTVVGTHFKSSWGAGIYGQWDTDPRIEEPQPEPFEIEMQGLAVFACRRDAWPGLNPRFRGFGGEEGYLHEKVRGNGGRTICLPALRWAHRFGRPNGVSYPLTWLDRVRNYYIGWGELGWDPTSMEEHFRELLGADPGELVLGQARTQAGNPFNFFDAVFCLNLDSRPERWAAMTERFKRLDIAWRVERFPAVEAREGCSLSFRRMVAEAKRRGYRNVLVFEDDAVFLDQTLSIVGDAVRDLEGRPWDLLYLGGCVWSQSFPFLENTKVLQRPTGLTCTHAVAFNHTAYDLILEEIPADEGPAFDSFIAEYAAVDQYLARRIREGAFAALVTFPRVASQPFLLEGADADLALRDRYVI